MYAIIETGGKQYTVSPGDVIDVELLGLDENEKVDFDSVLTIADGDDVTFGTPKIEGAKVSGEVVSNFRDKKVVAFKKKRRKGYTRTVGHRQNLTKVKILDISK